MWLLALNATCYLLWSLFSGHFHRDLLPLRVGALRQDIWLALTLRLRHRHSHYNAIQKLMYLGVLALGLLLVLSGLAIWKPVQLQGIGRPVWRLRFRALRAFLRHGRHRPVRGDPRLYGDRRAQNAVGDDNGWQT